MRISKLRIRNVLGVEELELSDLGALVAIHGKEGSGKSSILRAIALALGGKKSDPELLRHGAAEGEVWLLLEDGTEITRKVTAEGAGEAKVRGPRSGGERVLKGLTDLLSFNPVAFLAADARERVQRLLEALPAKLAEAELYGALPEGAARTLGVKKAPGPVDLLTIDRVRQGVYDLRRDANVERRRASETVHKLEASIPPAAESNGLAEKRRKLEAAVEGIEKALRKREADIRERYGPRVEELARRRAEEIEKLKDEGSAAIRLARQEADNDALELKQALAGLAEREKAAAAAEGARQVLESTREELVGLEERHGALDKALGEIDALKVKALEDLPFDGLEIRDGEIYVRDGHGEWVPWEKLNTAQQIRFAVRLAMLRTGELKAVLVDGLERMNPKFRERFLAEAEKAGTQLFVTWADDGGLEIEV